MQKYLTLAILFLIITPIHISAQKNIFIDIGGGYRVINGDYDFKDNSGTTYSTDVKKENSLAWKDKNVVKFQCGVGYKVSPKLSTSLSLHHYTKKAGYSNGIVFTEIIVIGNTKSTKAVDYDEELNWFSLNNIVFAPQYSLTNNIFVTAGIEYALLKLEYKSGDQYTDNSLGFLFGLGYEFPLSSQISLIGNYNYSINSYSGDKLWYEIIDFQLGGSDISFFLRLKVI